jgi:ribosome biogenesis GTPase
LGNKRKKIRTDFRKNRGERARETGWTRQFQTEELAEKDLVQSERLTGKGELTRRRTVVAAQTDDTQAAPVVQRDVPLEGCLAGRVLRVLGLTNVVEGPDRSIYHCALRRVLKTLATDQRHVVVAGDRVMFRPVPTTTNVPEGVIERIEPRRGTLSRTSRGRQHVIVTNVDQLLIVMSAAQPEIKPHLIDRFLVAAETAQIPPIICINKIDLVEPRTLQPLVGTYSQLGYPVLLLSAATGQGIERLKRVLRGKQSALAGQSGVGKSSLLNAADPSLQLPVAEVSRDTEKGKHTTTTAQLLPLSCGGYVVDTPGIRQFELWGIVREEIAGHFRDLRPFVCRCRFPDCTHTHEEHCAVKDAVADDLIDLRRYESYCHLVAGDEA